MQKIQLKCEDLLKVQKTKASLMWQSEGTLNCMIWKSMMLLKLNIYSLSIIVIGMDEKGDYMFDPMFTFNL